MITAYSKNITVNSGSSVPFNIVKVNKGDTASISGASIQLNACGVYTIEGNFTLSSDTAGDVTIQLYQDGIALSETESAVTVVADSLYNVSFITDVVKSFNSNPNVMCSSPINLQVIVTHSVEGSVVAFTTATIKEFRVIGR